MGGGRAENIERGAWKGVEEGVPAVKIPPSSSNSPSTTPRWTDLGREGFWGVEDGVEEMDLGAGREEKREEERRAAEDLGGGREEEKREEKGLGGGSCRDFAAGASPSEASSSSTPSSSSPSEA